MTLLVQPTALIGKADELDKAPVRKESNPIRVQQATPD